MPVVASKTNQTVTTSTPLEITALNARSAQVTISDAACYVALAYRPAPGVPGAYGPEERWMPTTTVISDEPIYGIRIRSAVTGQTATVDVSLST